MQESIVFLVRVQCRCKESSRSLSHLLMSFLYTFNDNEVWAKLAVAQLSIRCGYRRSVRLAENKSGSGRSFRAGYNV